MSKTKRSIKFRFGLPQPAYAFVRDMSVLTNSPLSQVTLLSPTFRSLPDDTLMTYWRRANQSAKDRKSTPPKIETRRILLSMEISTKTHLLELSIKCILSTRDRDSTGVRLLFLNLIKSWCDSPIGRRAAIITQTLDRIRLCLK